MSSFEQTPQSNNRPPTPVAALIMELAQKPPAEHPEPVYVDPMPNTDIEPQAHFITHHTVFPTRPDMEFATWNIGFGD